MSELRPALHIEDLLELGPLIMGDPKRDKIGAPKHLLRLAVLASEAKDDFYFTQTPIQASQALFAAPGSVGRLLLSPDVVRGVALAAALALLLLCRRSRLRTR